MALSKGCTIGLIILGIIFLLIIIALVVIWMNKDKIVEAGMNYMSGAMTQEISKNMPDGYTPEMVRQITTDLQAGIKARTVGPAAIQEIAMAFQTAMADKTIDSTEGRRILEMMQKALGREPGMTGDSTVIVPPDSARLAPDSL